MAVKYCSPWHKWRGITTQLKLNTWKILFKTGDGVSAGLGGNALSTSNIKGKREQQTPVLTRLLTPLWAESISWTAGAWEALDFYCPFLSQHTRDQPLYQSNVQGVTTLKLRGNKKKRRYPCYINLFNKSEERGARNRPGCVINVTIRVLRCHYLWLM